MIEVFVVPGNKNKCIISIWERQQYIFIIIIQSRERRRWRRKNSLSKPGRSPIVPKKKNTRESNPLTPIYIYIYIYLYTSLGW